MNRLQKFQFSQNWFNTSKQKTWKKVFSDYSFSSLPQYLEIGTYEGQSLIWVGQNLLPSKAKITALDNFVWQSHDILKKNLESAGLLNQVMIIKEDSQDYLRKIPNDSFDVIYIDGAHDMQSVFIDTLEAWRVLKSGGILVFDDYQYDLTYRPIDQRPDAVIDCFLTAFRHELKVLKKKNNQVFVLKTGLFRKQRNESLLGPYQYNWSERRLYKKDVPFILTEKEVLLLEKMLRQIQVGDTDINIHSAVFTSPSGLKLLKTLGLKKSDFILKKRPSD